MHIFCSFLMSVWMTFCACSKGNDGHQPIRALYSVTWQSIDQSQPSISLMDSGGCLDIDWCLVTFGWVFYAVWQLGPTDRLMPSNWEQLFIRDCTSMFLLQISRHYQRWRIKISGDAKRRLDILVGWSGNIIVNIYHSICKIHNHSISVSSRAHIIEKPAA